MLGEVGERVRARRRDAGSVVLTARDTGLLEIAAHQYGLPLDLLSSVLGVSAQAAHAVVGRWKRAGWVCTGKVDAGAMWVWPSRTLVRELLGWDVPGWRPRQTVSGHVRAVAAVRFHRVGLDVGRWVSERTLQHLTGWRPRGVPVPHMPDGVEVFPDGRRALVEVELSRKTRSRYLESPPKNGEADMVKGLLSTVVARARELECVGVMYWCAPNVLGQVQDVAGEFLERDRARRARARSPEALAPQLKWAIRDITEVPCWEPAPRRSAR
ncbi:hypothetical protein [Pseudonocardia sp. ICBG601]|uniref:hypothetical protein n=1 Tax=Pseudonocardia sp. ICBG601 TaxID=2846759 RepID=UPI001CF69F6D|nr:hypothetical protein [Pseudonocardia sp. ICBG601]